jgi:hypothetical protein
MLSLRENLLPFRNILEARGREAALLLRRNLPLATSAWDLHSLRRLEPSTRAEVIRSEASRLGLGTLDHRQMDRLLDLVSTRQGWRFQWEKTLEIRAGGGFIALLDRNLFDRPPDPPFRLVESGGKTRWGCGWILWEPAGIKKPAISDFSAFLPASEEMPCIMASSDALSQSRLAEIPWFYRKCWPTIVFGDKMSWTPFWGRSRELQRTGSLCYRLTYMPDQKMGVS